MCSFTGVKAQTIAGEYHMTGGHEMVAAFKFNEDHSFLFYFSYGAIDRSSKGHYTLNDGKIALQGDKTAGKDFTVASQKRSGDGTTIKISDPNSFLLRSVLCIFKKGADQDVRYTDGEGMAHSILNDCDTIYVMHNLFPDVLTTIKKEENKNNYFELTLNPSLAEISFKDFVLTLDKDTLTGSLPFLFEKAATVFVKSRN